MVTIDIHLQDTTLGFSLLGQKVSRVPCVGEILKHESGREYRVTAVAHRLNPARFDPQADVIIERHNH